MLVVGVLNGWSGSIKRRESRTSMVVHDALLREYPKNYVSLFRRSSLAGLGSRKMRRFVLTHNRKENDLLLVGKSLGAKNLLKHVIEPLWKDTMLHYGRLFVFTIDPCWPSWNDWSPNRNGQPLQIRAHTSYGVNVFLKAPDDVMAGSMVFGLRNVSVPHYQTTHLHIIFHKTVQRELKELVRKI